MFLRVYAREGKRLSTSFESFVAILNQWHGMYIELDGSFVWAFVSDGRRYQLDGMVYDREGAIEYLELKGDLIPEMWNQLITALVDDAPDSGGYDSALRVHDVANENWITPEALLQAIIAPSLRPPGGSDAD
jgi:hypothetical protein